MVVTLENKMFFNPLCLGQYKNKKVQMDSPKKKAVGEKIVVDAEDLLSIARDLESSSNIVHIKLPVMTLKTAVGFHLRLRSTASIRFRLENIFKPGFRRWNQLIGLN